MFSSITNTAIQFNINQLFAHNLISFNYCYISANEPQLLPLAPLR